MATVVLQGDLARRCTGGLTVLQVDAADYRELLSRLGERFPALVEAIRAHTAVAIDGEIFQDPLLEPIGPDSEVHFMPMIGGGSGQAARRHPVARVQRSATRSGRLSESEDPGLRVPLHPGYAG